MILSQRISPSLSEKAPNLQAPVCKQGGFTLIELMVVIAIGGILSTIAIGYWSTYRESTRADVAKGQIVNMLQQARLKALSSGEEQRVRFIYADDSAISATGQLFSFEGVNVQKFSCNNCTAASAPEPNQNFKFKRRGSGTGRSLKVSSRNKTYIISVNGVTGRMTVNTKCSTSHTPKCYK